MEITSDYGQDLEKLRKFILESECPTEGRLIYRDELGSVATGGGYLMVIKIDHLMIYDSSLKDSVVRNPARYIRMLSQIVGDELFKLTNYAQGSPINKSRIERARQLKVENISTLSDLIDGLYPAELFQDVQVALEASSQESIAARNLKSMNIGKLVCVHGLVTAMTSPSPRLTIASYICTVCNTESFKIVEGQTLTPPTMCGSDVCKAHKLHNRLEFWAKGSKFIDYQTLQLQEHIKAVPSGQVPRQITIVCSGEQTSKCNLGDYISVTGIYLTLVGKHYCDFKSDLSTDTYISASNVRKLNSDNYGDSESLHASGPSIEACLAMVPERLDLLKRSLAPDVHGYEDVKESLLLMLVGGNDTDSKGMKIRGNINICLLGDPGIAKSQLLSYIKRISPNCQYATGRGASGVGLTAAVMRDSATGDFYLESGALVRADGGICCIDEFDKMAESDRTSLHEVMEQQTVSIAKAGLSVSLNARTTILAAANSIYGYYNNQVSLTENLGMPTSLVSRFDLIWVCIDSKNTEHDRILSEFVLSMHREFGGEQAASRNSPLDVVTMKQYIEQCKAKKPKLPSSVTQHLVDFYSNIRSSSYQQRNIPHTSPRNLLSVIRIATAYAKLRLADDINVDDINQAINIYECAHKSSARSV